VRHDAIGPEAAGAAGLRLELEHHEVLEASALEPPGRREPAGPGADDDDLHSLCFAARALDGGVAQAVPDARIGPDQLAGDVARRALASRRGRHQRRPRDQAEQLSA
jgi:hypothetical protein